MLSAEENELLTRVGPGTPMGELMRRYWIPALLSRELPEPDCPPVRVRLLGEDLVAFRDSAGQVGLLSEYCSHRRASLFFGRNEECGLRCIYHGWKYDVAGKILETPVEPPESMLKHHVRQRAYPCHEANGLILTYMGPSSKVPLVPDYRWLTLPADHVVLESKMFNENNWLQGLEGDIDSAHAPILHRQAQPAEKLSLGEDVPLRLEVETTRWGVKAAAIRGSGADAQDVRFNLFVMPCLATIRNGHTIYQVPADDENVWRYDLMWRSDRPYSSEDVLRNGRRGASGYDSWREVGAGFRKIANRSNDYLIDREKQRTRIYCGLDFANHTQDAAVTESMGPICDRTQEHLGVGDAQIVAVRQLLLDAIRDLQRGLEPPGLAWTPEENDFSDAYPAGDLSRPVAHDGRELSKP